ncbi:hypothetical protein CkaCkLH20_12987 [Colletotrichum karsti]|uniref:Uncharacterized protein n=1 Tax=Colletotrichum karsti TaxID=1095194 RepID=A0A9P6LCT2_9PEZI|nr:uncharacterized protein CkaCkLH20_12987 [Colletotrichum karsti]KAF9869594.1 hypothetical protein CkaCkLH20_12987 [Colletotrichum karsti]
MRPEQQLNDLIRTFPGPDANTTAMNHPGLTESKVQQTLQYYGLDTLGAQYLAQDVLHCRKNYNYYKMLAEKEGKVWPPEDVIENGKAGLKAEPTSKAIVMMLGMGIVLFLVILFFLFIKAGAWLHPQL